jgi:dolichyl-phosphate-mannose--protein O-mannosyl transferase
MKEITSLRDIAAREMFGTSAAFIALTLVAFDPNLLAHGALITTDVGLACFMFLSVYMFYRFVKSPSALPDIEQRLQSLSTHP